MNNDSLLINDIWPSLGPFLAQAVILSVVVLLLVRAARLTLARGQGVEVPLWLLVVFCIPILGPIFALIHFGRQRAIS